MSTVRGVWWQKNKEWDHSDCARNGWAMHALQIERQVFRSSKPDALPSQRVRQLRRVTQQLRLLAVHV